MLKRDFEAFLTTYLKDKKKYTNLPSPKSLNDLDATQILGRLESAFEERSDLPNNYKFKGSVGKTQMAEIPHLCLMDTDVTQTPQEEYYIAYLFSADLSSVYLSLNQGWTLYEKTYGRKRAKREIAAVAKILQSVVDEEISGFSIHSISLNGKDDLGQGYELGNICSKRYERGAIPSDNQLLKDLKQLVRVYQELKYSIQGSVIALGDQGEIDFQKKIQSVRPFRQLPDGPIPMKSQSMATKYYWRRDPVMSAMALGNAKYKCELDGGHRTFDLPNGNYFMEAHHLVPMSLQQKFEYCLDVPENIISLCPNCHRAFHHAVVGERKEMAREFYKKRKKALEDRGIWVNLRALLNFYSHEIEEEPE